MYRLRDTSQKIIINNNDEAGFVLNNVDDERKFKLKLKFVKKVTSRKKYCLQSAHRAPSPT